MVYLSDDVNDYFTKQGDVMPKNLFPMPQEKPQSLNVKGTTDAVLSAVQSSKEGRKEKGRADREAKSVDAKAKRAQDRNERKAKYVEEKETRVQGRKERKATSAINDKDDQSFFNIAPTSAPLKGNKMIPKDTPLKKAEGEVKTLLEEVGKNESRSKISAKVATSQLAALGHIQEVKLSNALDASGNSKKYSEQSLTKANKEVSIKAAERTPASPTATRRSFVSMVMSAFSTRGR